MADAEAKEAEEDRRKQALIKERLKQKKLELQGKVTKEVKEEKKKTLKIPKGDMDFLALSKEHGFVQARNMLRQNAIRHHQKSIDKVDLEIKSNYRTERVKEAMVQSYTSGEPNSERPIDKIQEAAAAAPKPVVDREETQLERQFNADIAYRRAIIDGTGDLTVAQYNLEYMPASLGDTLFLQTLFLRNISLPRNKITTLFSHHTPQLSSTHLRYIENLNMQGNKIKRLSGDIGNMKGLKTLNVADNILSSLPPSISTLSNLVEINLMGNSFCDLPRELCWVTSLRKIVFKKNIFVQLPTPLPRLIFLEELDFSHNMIYHLAIQPPLLKPEDLWKRTINMRTGGDLWVNIITKEAVKDPAMYNGRGLELATELHEFQRPGTEAYRRRKTWLSINQIQEFDTAEDEATGWTYYKNNVSGDTLWDMPKSMDTLGMLGSLTSLDLSYNFMRSLCPSICKLKSLRKLLLIKNRIHELPENIGDLKNLQLLNVHGNEIHLLPVSICDCESLTDLLVEDNQLIRLPDKIGYHKKIVKITCTANRMKTIPFTIGFNESIKALNFMENPLEDPPVAEVYKGLDHLKWYLRSRFMLNERGAPPSMEFHNLSTMLEVTILKPELMQRVISMCNVAKTNGGFLNLQSMGIGEVPREVLKVKKLKKLILDTNNTLYWPEKLGMPKELSMLKALSMKACNLSGLPENLSNLKRLSSLCCEENRIEALPSSITKLKNLTDLDVPKNRIYAIPDRLEYCTALKYINFEDNFLSSVPNSFGTMKGLLTLNLAKNRLIDLPNSLCGLVKLKKLNVECNKLKALPVELRMMSVTELRIGHNQIEYLEEDLFSFKLGKSIILFSFCENNILELPNSLSEVSPECHLEPDFNPLISPPPFLIAEGVPTLQRYLFIRKKRIDEIDELLADEDFMFVKENATPQSFETLEDGTGFLTPADLLEFDQAVDEYVNGEYYRCPASGEEIVENLVKLRELREIELYHLILNTFIKTIEDIVKKKDKRFGDAVLLTQQRPWGRKGEMCYCWVLSLQALLRDAPVSQFHKQGRPSVFSMIAAQLPPMAFPFTVELLKDAMRLYFSPFGQVADTEQIAFPGCDCVDEKRFKPLRHSPCDKPAIIIVKTIYVEEEVQRREVEEEEYMDVFKDVDMEVTIWLNTELGILETEKEIKLRDARLIEDINLRTEMLDMERFNLAQNNKELLKAKTTKEKFERGEPFADHGCESIGDAIGGITAAEDKIEKTKERTKRLEVTISKMKGDQATDLETKQLRAQDDLIQKYICLKYQTSIKICRTFAAMRGLRRPWDGDDGKLYKKWHDGYINRSGEVLTMKQLREREEIAADESALANEKPGEETLDCTWEGCENMMKYTFPLYLRYMTGREADREEEKKNKGKENEKVVIKEGDL